MSLLNHLKSLDLEYREPEMFTRAILLLEANDWSRNIPGTGQIAYYRTEGDWDIVFDQEFIFTYRIALSAKVVITVFNPEDEESRAGELFDVLGQEPEFFYVQDSCPAILHGVKILGTGFFLCQGSKIYVGSLEGRLCCVYTLDMALNFSG